MWLAGEQFSLADIAYTPYLTRLAHLQMSELWFDRPHLANWFKQIQVRKSYDIAIIQWLNPKYLTLMEETGKKEMAAIRKILDRTM
jgi:glutathione S-transferase